MNKSSNLLESEIESFFNNSTMKLRWIFRSQKKFARNQNSKKLEAVNLMKNKIKKCKKKS